VCGVPVANARGIAWPNDVIVPLVFLSSHLMGAMPPCLYMRRCRLGQSHYFSGKSCIFRAEASSQKWKKVFSYLL